MNNQERRFAEQQLYSLTKFLMSDEAWQIFGFRKRPRRGSFFDRFVARDRLAYEHFVFRELLLIGITLLDRGIESSNGQLNKEAIVKWIIDQFVYTVQLRTILDLSSDEEAMSTVLDGLGAYRAASVEGVSGVASEMFCRARDGLSGKYRAQALVGVAQYSLAIDGIASRIASLADSSGNDGDG